MLWLKRIWTILWKSAAFVILWAFLYAPFVTMFASRVERQFPSSPHILRLYFDATGALAILLAAWFMARFVDRRAFSTLGFAPTSLVRDALLGSAIGFIWLALSLALMWLLGWVTPQPAGNFSLSALAIPALAMLLNTVIQEVLARSYTFQVIRSQAGPGWAIFVSSVVFMLYHAGGLRGAWLPAFNVFCSGVLFAVAFYRSGNLWLPIAIHFAWNFLLGPVLGLAVSGQDLGNYWRLFTVQGPAIFTGGAFGIEGSLVVTLITVVCMIAIWLWAPARSQAVENQDNFGEGRRGKILVARSGGSHE